ncbi:4'-phosphopantetheinyl transferase superfamily protein, partial [Streptomyces sp. NPDC051907]|uniref:4'-phosphopantetheinyl transferase superfamily protein n=1 Tax=Streptomyces sp. NPDC051907 TaxID=3155284 RepID=UPI00341E3071
GGRPVAGARARRPDSSGSSAGRSRPRAADDGRTARAAARAGVVLLAADTAGRLARLIEASPTTEADAGADPAVPGPPGDRGAGHGARGSGAEPGATGPARPGASDAADGAPASGGACRLAVVGLTPKRKALAAAVVARGKPWRGRGGVWFSPRPLLAHEGRLAFLFPGLEPDFTPRLDDVADRFQLARPALGGGSTLVERAVDAVAVGRFFARVLPELGVHADLLAGHSLGEWTAMAVAGMYPQQAVDAFLDSLKPGDLAVPDLVYAALGCGAQQAAEALHGLDRVAVSHDNCPHQSVLCGEPTPVAEALARLAAQGVLAQELPFRSGFHTPMWAPYLDQVRGAFRRLPLSSSTVPVWSATTGAAFPQSPDDVREVVLRHLLEPVRFRELTARLYAEGVRAFVQMGPGSLPGFVSDTLSGRDVLAVAAGASKEGGGLDRLRGLAAALWTEGLDVRWERLALEEARPAPGLLRLDLGSPLVRLDGSAPSLGLASAPRPSPWPAGRPRTLAALDAVLDETEAAARAVALACRPGAAPASRPAPAPAPRPVVTRRRLSLDTMPYVRDHCVYLQPDDWPEPSDRFPVVPMTTLLELAADAARDAVPGLPAVTGFDDVRALRWLPVAPPVDAEITATPADGPRVRVEIAGCATVVVRLAHGHPTSRPHPDRTALTREGPAPVSADALYRDRWMFHGPGFAGVHEVTAVADDGIRGVLRALPAPGALLDAAGQLLGHWMQLRLPADRLVFPASLERISLYGPAPREGALLRAVARIRDVGPSSVRGDVELTAADGTVWARLDGWTYRRFAADERVWPMKFTPEICGIGEPQPGGWCLARRRWSDPASQELVMRRYLGAAERAAYERRPPRARAAWLLGRIAAKDAVRNLLWEHGAGPLFPAEVPVANDEQGRPRPQGAPADGIRLSLAHKDRLAVALAHRGHAVGIDVEEVTEDPAALSRIALTAPERALAERLAAREGHGPAQALTALWCAKEAAAKAEGTGLGGRLRQWTVEEGGPTGLRVLSPQGRDHAVRITAVHDLSGPGRHAPPAAHVVAWTAPPTPTPTEASHDPGSN